jgi:Uma2 family endonuclease
MQVEAVLDRAALVRRWQQLAADPDTPDYYELNEYGEVIMSPTFVPDVCAEVLSPGNTREEIAMKTAAYLRGGAKEVIVVGLKGEIELFGAEGKRAASALGIVLSLPASLF